MVPSLRVDPEPTALAARPDTKAVPSAEAFPRMLSAAMPAKAAGPDQGQSKPPAGNAPAPPEGKGSPEVAGQGSAPSASGATKPASKAEEPEKDGPPPIQAATGGDLKTPDPQPTVVPAVAIALPPALPDLPITIAPPQELSGNPIVAQAAGQQGPEPVAPVLEAIAKPVPPVAEAPLPDAAVLHAAGTREMPAPQPPILPAPEGPSVLSPGEMGGEALPPALSKSPNQSPAPSPKLPAAFHLNEAISPAYTEAPPPNARTGMEAVRASMVATPGLPSELAVETPMPVSTSSTFSAEGSSTAFTLQAESHPLIRELLAQPRVEPERLTLSTPKALSIPDEKDAKPQPPGPELPKATEIARGADLSRETAPSGTQAKGVDRTEGPAASTTIGTQPSNPTVTAATATFTAPLPNTLSAPTASVQNPAPVATAPHPAMTQVEGSIRWLLNRERAGAELQLHPESLGRVTIQLRVEGGEVHARVWASEPTTVPLLQEHKGHLELALREQGLHLGSFDLHQGQRGGQNPAEQAPWQGSSPRIPLLTGLDSRQETPLSFPSRSTHRGLVEVFA